MPAKLDVTGLRFEKLVAVRRTGTRKYPGGGKPRSLWLFRCDCGKEVEKSLADVKRADTKSCGCDRFGKPAANRLEGGEASFNGLLARYRASARGRGHDWGLSKEEFRALTAANCHYCGAPPTAEHLTHASAFGAYVYTGVDRADNSKGYTTGNVVPCCGTCNRAKAVMPQAEFLAWVRRVYGHCYGE